MRLPFSPAFRSCGRRLIPIVCGLLLMLSRSAPAQDLIRQAEVLADTRIENFRNASNDVSRRTAFLEMQGDPIAVSRLNAPGPDGKPKNLELIQRANQELVSIREPVKARVQAEVAARYNVDPKDVSFVEYGKTPQSHPDKFGQDWDLTARVNGRDVPAPISQRIAHQAYLDEASLKGRVEINVSDPKTGEARPITADEFAHRQSLAVTDSKHADAYGTGTTGGKAINEIAAGNVDPGVRLRDPTQLTQAVEYKSNEAAVRAAEFEEHGRAVDAQGQHLEDVRQSTKQFDKFVKPMVEANGGRVPPTLQEGNAILNRVTTGELTRAQAEAQLAELGARNGGQPLTIRDVVQRNAQLIEAAQVLKAPGERGPAIDADDFIDSVRDRLSLKNIDPDAVRSLDGARGQAPLTEEQIAARRSQLVENLRSNELLDPDLRNKLADSIELKDLPEVRAEAERLRLNQRIESRVTSALNSGLQRAGELMLISDGLNLAQDLVDVSQGKKSGSEVAHSLADMASLGVLGLSQSLTEKALDYADAQDAVRLEQAAQDAARIMEIGRLLRDADVNQRERLDIMQALSRGDESLLQDKLNALKEQGTELTIPERQIVTTLSDESYGARAEAVLNGFKDRFARAGQFALDTPSNLLEIPWSAFNAVATSLDADQLDFSEKTRKDEMVEALVARGADPDHATAVVSIFFDSAGKERELLDRLRFDLSMLEMHPDLRQLSEEERDRALYRLHEQYLASLSGPADDANAAAAGERADNAAGNATAQGKALATLAGFLSQLEQATSSTPELVAVPQVVGRDVASAQQLLTTARLMPQGAIARKKPDNIKPMIVFGQEPAAGTQVPAGTAITIVYSSPGAGPTETLKVPDITRLSRADAETKLKELKFEFVAVAGKERPPRTAKKQEVYRQSPQAGTEVKEGETVRFEYYAGIPVGRYVGLKKADAEQAILKDQLKPLVNEGEQMAQTALERLKVYEQKPAPGEYVWFDEPVEALYYKVSVGFQEGDGALLDPRFAAAKVGVAKAPQMPTGSPEERTSLNFASGNDPGKASERVARALSIDIRLFTDTAAPKAQVATLLRDGFFQIEDMIVPGVLRLTVKDRETGPNIAKGTLDTQTQQMQLSSHVHMLVYREKFLITFLHTEPVSGYDYSKESASIIRKSKELIDLRFPED